MRQPDYAVAGHHMADAADGVDIDAALRQLLRRHDTHAFGPIGPSSRINAKAHNDRPRPD